MKKVRTSINFYAKHVEKFIVQNVVKQTNIQQIHYVPIKIHSLHNHARNNKNNNKDDVLFE